MKTQGAPYGLSQRLEWGQPFSLRFLLLISVIGLAGSNGLAQTCKSFAAQQSIVLDLFPIERSSIRVFPEHAFQFTDSTGVIEFDSLIQDSIKVCYYTLNPTLLTPFFKRDIKNYATGKVNRSTSSPKPVINDIFGLDGFESYGSITRGVGFGNRQNVFVNSALNLQLEGQLSDNLFVSASITDQNIPYQPEGNTQQLRDFDNVYIKLYNESFDLTVGDIVFTNPIKDAYFLKYYKNVQGLQLNTVTDLGERWRSKTTLSGSAAKGQFATVQIDPLEGVQGPYRLVGPNNEQFLIILANSEHVFIDGVEMQRGFDRDYVIDYNLAEITFSPNVLITRFTRIRIDFEYSDQYYGRSNFNVTQQFSDKRNTFFLSLYQEKDNTNNTLGFTPTDNDLFTLSTLGDVSIGQISGVDSVGYSDSGIYYEKKDTLISGQNVFYYIYSVDPDLAVYQVSFSNLGPGKGSYQIIETTSNGRIYEWVGQSNGSFEPLITVPTPNKKQVVVVGDRHQLTKYELYTQEFAFSNSDRNLYSSIDDNNNLGFAWKSTIKSEGRNIDLYKFSGLVSYEQLTSSFSAIDRFRGVEYDRNWGYNIFSDSISRSDQILSTEASLRKDAHNFMEWNFGYRNRDEVVKGYQNDLYFSKLFGPVLLKSSWFLLNNDPGLVRNTWIRGIQEVRLNTPIVKPGYLYTSDRQESAVLDSVINTLMNYRSHDFYLLSGDSLKTTFRLDYIDREDQRPVEGQLEKYTKSDEYRLSTQSRFSNQQLGVFVIYRKVNDMFLKNSGENILGKLDWKGTFWQKNIRNSLTYSTSSTRELKREFVYILVPTGQGTHTWRDENEDGIQDLNEFYEAINADEKNYIKLFTPTSEYLDANQSTLQHNLDVSLPNSNRAKNGLFAPLTALSFNTNSSINQKTVSNQLEGRLFPFFTDLRTSDILFARNYHRYSLFYNRNGEGLAIDLKFSETSGKSLLSNGYELQKKHDWQHTLRIPFTKSVTFRFQNGWGTTRNESDYLTSRNFNIDGSSVSPQLVFQPNSSIRIITKAEHRMKETPHKESQSFSKINDYSLESTWAKSNSGNLNMSFQWISIDFQGDKNSYLGYELLEGLQQGQNQRWTLNWQQSVGRGMQLTLQYVGRKSPGLNTIHTGNMQLTAYF